jgi:hypothetical protein
MAKDYIEALREVIMAEAKAKGEADKLDIPDAEILVEFKPEEAVPGTVRQWFGPTVSVERAQHYPVPKGPWSNEPRKIQWVDASTGLPCLIVRNPVGALCGYTGVYAGHPFHKVEYSQCTVKCGKDYCYDHSPEAQLQVHGGITFSEACAHSEDESDGICHIPEPGTSDDVWWFGFDCAHGGDLIPGMMYTEKAMDIVAQSKGEPPFPTKGVWSRTHDIYKDVNYVKDEVASLASQLKTWGDGIKLLGDGQEPRV